MGEAAALSGPDLEQGVPATQIADGGCLVGHAHGEAILLVRRGERVFATSATCTHYNGPLGEGIVVEGTVRCPLHHACFDLETGEVVGAPALAPLGRFEVQYVGGQLRVGAKLATHRRTPPTAGPASVVIVGAGAAGTACAVTLRSEGYAGSITLLSDRSDEPVDRPNVSKDFLAGTAPADWMPLRTAEALAEERIELVSDDPAVALDATTREVRLKSGRRITGGALVLATGAEPSRLPIEGAGLPHVHVVRTLGDARGVIESLAAAKRAVVVGASFIGLECAASLRQCGLEVTVVAPDTTPLERVLGAEVGRFIQGVYASHGVHFALGIKPSKITPTAVWTSDARELLADVVIVGVGVRPRTALAEAAGLRVDNGIVVDVQLQTAAVGVYAAGDVARFPYDGGTARIEHWVHAERQGQAIARTLVGRGGPFRDVPYFWSQHFDVTLAYIGHAETYDAVEVHGDLEARDATVVYRQAKRPLAVLTVGRDRQSLQIERAMETGDTAAIEKLLAG